MDLRARKRFIIRTVWLAIPAPILVGWLAFRYMPTRVQTGLDLSGDRLAFAGPRARDPHQGSAQKPS